MSLSMRKDKIEERMAGIERDMKDMRSEIRQEIASMASEMKETQVALVENMLEELQDAMSSGYRQVAYELYISNSEKKFKEQYSYDCPPGCDRDGCISGFVEDHLRKGIRDMDAAPPDMAGTVVKSLLDSDNAEYESDRGTACQYCRDIYSVERDNLLSLGEKFAAYRKSMSLRRNVTYFKHLPDDLTVTEIIDPLSHRARFVMLKNLTSGSMSFKDLGEITGYDGGHLVYHLNKLVSAGLVSKEGSGLYQITDKGMDVMEVVRKMHGKQARL